MNNSMFQNAEATDTSADIKLLKEEVRNFIEQTQLELERERSSLLTKCTALEEEIS